MKIAIVNYSGNVGKTTLTRHLLAPRMNNPTIITVESINNDNNNENSNLNRFRGDEFDQIQKTLLDSDDAIVDIGASNVEPFLQRMAEYLDSHEDFDYFLIPTTTTAKQLEDTATTVKSLTEIGVPIEKIRIVFNMVKPTEKANVRSAYTRAELPEKIYNPNAIVYFSDAYKLARESKVDITGLANDGVDYKAQIPLATSIQERDTYASLLCVKRLAKGVCVNMDYVFDSLFNN